MYSILELRNVLSSIGTESGSAAVSVKVDHEGRIRFVAGMVGGGVTHRLISPCNLVPFVDDDQLTYDNRYVSA